MFKLQNCWPTSKEQCRGMECLAGFRGASSILPRQSLFCSRKTLRVYRLTAKINCTQHKEEDPLLNYAISRASLRFQEANSSEPLFIDPYAACFVSSHDQMDMKHHLHHYCLATKFIDDKLLDVIKNIDGVKQVVLLTDGMDTRPYRLNWPTSTIIFDVSPEKVSSRAAQILDDVGAKIPRSCLFVHVPLESSDIQQVLRSKGFNGNRPSIWMIEGFPVMNLANFTDILSVVSNLATKGCLLLGALPIQLGETEQGTKKNVTEWLDKLFVSYGFRVSIIGYDEIARKYARDSALGEYNNFLFVAEHLRFSDDQMEAWRRELQRLEEEADEEGFEEL